MEVASQGHALDQPHKQPTSQYHATVKRLQYMHMQEEMEM